MEPLAPKAAERFGRYELVARLGVGGMAEVWLAQISGVSGFKKTLVIKTMHPNLAEAPEFVKMFIKEASLAARLNHPNIVQIYDLGEIDARYFIAMEYIPGRSLRQIRARVRKLEGDAPKAFPHWFLLNTVLRACDGLHYSHEFCDVDGTHLGLVHRDISPENIMVSFAGAVKLLDFGVAKMSAVEKTMAGGTLVGKFGYMAPEQASGGRTDRRADVYALGVILYEFLTGVRPFRGANEVVVLRQTLEGNFTHPQEIEPSIPDEIARIVVKAMAREPGERYQSAAELQADILTTLQGRGLLSDQNQMAIYVSSLFPESSEIPAHVKNALAAGPPPSATAPVPPSLDRVSAVPRSHEATPAPLSGSAGSQPGSSGVRSAQSSRTPVPTLPSANAAPAPVTPPAGAQAVVRVPAPPGAAPLVRVPAPEAVVPAPAGGDRKAPAAASLAGVPSQSVRPAEAVDGGRARPEGRDAPVADAGLPELDWQELDAKGSAPVEEAAAEASDDGVEQDAPTRAATPAASAAEATREPPLVQPSPPAPPTPEPPSAPARSTPAIEPPSRDLFVVSRPQATPAPDLFGSGSREPAPPASAAAPTSAGADIFSSGRPTREQRSPDALFAVGASVPASASTPDLFGRPSPKPSEDADQPSSPVSAPASPDVFGAFSASKAKEDSDLPSSPPATPGSPDVFGRVAQKRAEEGADVATPNVFGARAPAKTGVAEEPSGMTVFAPLPRAGEERSAEAFAGLVKRGRAEITSTREPEAPPKVHTWGPYEKIGSEAPAPRPTSAAACFEQGLAHIRAKELDQALAAWERAVALEPDNRSYQSNLQRLKEKLKSK